jgi:CheY-like chemotaxis protein
MVRLVRDHVAEQPEPGLSDVEKGYLHGMQVAEAFANLQDGHVAQRMPILNRLLREGRWATPEQMRQNMQLAVARVSEAAEIFMMPAPDPQTLQSLVEQTTAAELSVAAEETGPVAATTRSQPKPLAAADLVATAEASALTPRAVVIDDEPAVCEFIRRTLDSEGIPTESFADAFAAANTARGASILLVDVHLPGESGIDLVRTLRGAGFAAPIIMLSGDRTRETVASAVSAGANDYLVKPFDIAKLLEKVRRYLPG